MRGNLPLGGDRGRRARCASDVARPLVALEPIVAVAIKTHRAGCSLRRSRGTRTASGWRTGLHAERAADIDGGADDPVGARASGRPGQAICARRVRRTEGGCRRRRAGPRSGSIAGGAPRGLEATLDVNARGPGSRDASGGRRWRRRRRGRPPLGRLAPGGKCGRCCSERARPRTRGTACLRGSRRCRRRAASGS